MPIANIPSTATNNPYAYDLPTEFQNRTQYSTRNMPGSGRGPFGGIGYSVETQKYDTSGSSDSDVRRAQSIFNQLEQQKKGYLSGLDVTAATSELNMLKSRIALKNALGKSIADNPMQEQSAEQDIRNTADQTLTSGLKKTKENYNRRGLLYSGYREGGEQKVRAGVASNLASGLSNTKREYETAADAAKAAYVSVGLQNQQEMLNMANQAFDSANANSIARMQAMQELGGGIGQAMGYYFGSQSSPGVSASSYTPLETNRYSNYSVAPGLVTRSYNEF